MANLTNCKNCGTENPYFQLKCKNCQSFLRRRVVNIELWETAGKVIESPSKAFENVIFAEHKNFLIFMTLLFGFAILADLNFASNFLFEQSLISSALFSFAAIISLSFLNAFLVKIILLAFNNKTRFLDNYYLVIFANIPQIFSLILLLPVQFALFGEYWLTFNPSPIAFKATQSLIILGIEGVLLLWSFVLIFISFKTSTKSNFESILVTLITIIMTYILPLYVIHNFF